MNINTDINREKLAEIAAESVGKLNPNDASDKRWISAIARAVREIETNAYLTFQPETQTLLIMSLNTTGNLYEANGVCQCFAYKHEKPCWHRAACRLILRYLETQ